MISVCECMSGGGGMACKKMAYRVRGLGTNTAHDGDQDVLLNGEGAWVNRDTKDLDSGHETSPKPDKREGQQLDDDLMSGFVSIHAREEE